MAKPTYINRFVSFSSLLSVVVGLLGLAGCYLHMPILRTVLPGMVAIAANTSVCFVLLGVSLWWLRERETHVAGTWTKWVAKLAASAAGVVGFASLVEYLGNLNFGIDQLIFTEPSPAVLGHVRPGLMSPITSLDLVLLGSALLLLDWVTRRRTWPAQVLCFIAGILAVFVLVDLVVEGHQFQAHIALSTVTVLAVFPFAVICARPKRALGGLLAASGSKRALVRELFFSTSVPGGSLGAPLQYALAVVLVAAATVLRHWLAGYLPPLMIFLTYYPAVTVAALLGGLGPGALATLLAATCANYFFLPPVGVFTIASHGDLLGLLMFIGIGLTISWLASTLEQTRTEATAALQESESNFRTLANFVPQMVWMCKPDGLNIYFNQRWFDYTGMTPEESCGRGWSTPFHPHDRQDAWDAWNRTVATGETYQVESRLRASDGSYRWFLMRGTPSRDGSGQIVRWFGTCTDIDDIKHSEAELAKLNQELEERVCRRTAELQAIFDTSPIGLAIADDIQCRHICGNPAIERLVGLGARAELSKTASIAAPYRIFKDGSELSPDKLPMQRAARGEMVSGEVMEIHRADGSIVTAYTSAAPLLDEQHRPRGAVGAFLDITALKRAEEALRDSQTDLAKAQAAVHLGNWRWELAQKVISWSEELYRIFGVDPGTFVPTDAAIRNLIHPDDRALHAESIGRVLAGGAAAAFECRVIRPDGEIRWTLASGFDVKLDGCGKPETLFGTVLDITERKAAEAALRETTQRFQTIVDHAPIAIYVKDSRGRFLFGNRRLERYTGLPLERLLGMTDSDFASKEDADRWHQNDLKVLAGQSTEFEEAGTDCEGRPYVNLSVKFPLSDESGSPAEVCGISTDITAIKHTEEALRESEQLLRAVTDNSPDSIYVKDRSSRWLMANPAVLRIVGKTAEQALGKTDLELYADAVVGRAILDNDRRIMEGGRTEAFEEVADTPDGRRTFLSVKAPRRDGQGSIVGVIGISRDITEQKQAEEALRQSESRFRTLANSVPDLVWTCTPEGECDFFSSRWIEYTGIAEKSQLGYGWLSQIYPDDQERVKADWQKLVEQSQPLDIEYRIRNADGVYRWFKSRAVALRDPHGRVLKWFGTNTDIEEQRRLQEDLAAANKELECFNYAVAHDLRAPLRHIHGFADLLAREAASVLNDTSQKHLRFIQESIERMSGLLQELLNLSRIGRQELRRQECDLNSLVRQVLTDFQPDILDRHIEWRIGDLPEVECDPTLMKQVLSNLLSNALKFTRERRPALIEVGQIERDGVPVIFIRDNGQGFDMKYADKLFGVFQRLHRQEEFEGTGVGLAIVQRIIHRHGGSVWAEAQPNCGATFYFSLQACELEQHQVA